MNKADIKNLNLKELEELLVSLGEQKFRARQIFAWIYERKAKDFDGMSDLSAELRKKLNDRFLLYSLGVIKLRESTDGTKKFLLSLKDKNIIEAVIIPAEERVTGCISTQAGCKYACRFCASGALGFIRNLTCGEIIEQVLLLNEQVHLTHIVFMGTGEPLDNYENVLKAARIINSKDGLNIGARRITISSAGIVPGIRRLSDEGLQIELSVSLHAAVDKARSLIMPVNKKYPLTELVDACKDYAAKTGRQVTFEYVLIKGLNMDLPNAKNLVKIVKEVAIAKVNLIPVNPVKIRGIEPPNKLELLSFKDFLKKNGVNVTLRRERGQDIEAACGQLRLNYAAQ